jgi:hypothetical protein
MALGSSDSYRFFWQTALQLVPEKKEVVDKLLWYVTEKLPVTLVDPKTAFIINELQNSKEITVLGFTARPPFWEITTKQLNSVEIDFSNSFYPKELENWTSFHKGILFTSGQLKGAYLQEVLHSIPFTTKKIVFVDDKETQIQSVDEMTEKENIECDCYWYRSAEDQRKPFDPLLATIQLDYLINKDTILKDSEASLLKNLYSDRDLNEWILQIINNFETGGSY